MMETNEGAGQRQESIVGVVQLFPADDNSTPAIEPGEEAFDHPSSGDFGRFQSIGSFLGLCLGRMRLPIPSVIVAIETHMRLISFLVKQAVDHIVVIASIQTQMLG